MSDEKINIELTKDEAIVCKYPQNPDWLKFGKTPKFNQYEKDKIHRNTDCKSFERG